MLWDVFHIHTVTKGLRHGDPFAAFIKDNVKQAKIEYQRQG